MGIDSLGNHLADRWKTALGAGLVNTVDIKVNLTRGALQDMFNLSTLEYGSSRAFENLGLNNNLVGTGYSSQFGMVIVIKICIAYNKDSFD